LTTESLLEKNIADPQCYAHHAVGSVATDLARRYGCTGPVVTVSTACSSGDVAIKVAAEMLRRGMAKRVLAGGADALCRLTYFGFRSLQLIDPLGARPLDRDRRGMSVAEGAGMLLLTTEAPRNKLVQLLGAGLSCDAHHATTPHPQGEGALTAMRAALNDAGLSPSAIDYVNLHGTGTLDNDLAEARAVNALFNDRMPPLSSTKGAMGHTLAAAGAIEAVIGALCIDQDLVPANVGYRNFDPLLKLEPVSTPLQAPVRTMMSNSFGFGGNNAALVIGTSPNPSVASSGRRVEPFAVIGHACITGAGHTQETREAFFANQSCSGCLDEGQLSKGLSPRVIRRLKRLPRLALALTANACRGTAPAQMPRAVSMGTGWGALSETHDFLRRLSDTAQQFPSPTDFIGSVHNAPAGQIALMMDAKGVNVTTTGGDYTFEQALLTADLLTRDATTPFVVVGADESHPVFSPLFDPSVRAVSAAADGGGALLLEGTSGAAGSVIDLAYYRSSCCPDGMAGLIQGLGGAEQIRRNFGVVLAGLPAAVRAQASEQLSAFISASRFNGPVIDYRRHTGEFAAASAVAAVLAVEMAVRGSVPAPLAGGTPGLLKGRGCLLLGLGPYITAVRISPS
ncbi:MAG: beta-ketoacyl synthase chain length factor, partial [Desulfobacterales bacterium]|nr:beta-ketoacyl synthase chain length factor [Desulfobacterales bacterium]